MTEADKELITLLKKATPLRIAGREPVVDWHGERPKDQSVTMCVRLSRKDRNRLIRALRRG